MLLAGALYHEDRHGEQRFWVGYLAAKSALNTHGRPMHEFLGMPQNILEIARKASPRNLDETKVETWGRSLMSNLTYANRAEEIDAHDVQSQVMQKFNWIYPNLPDWKALTAIDPRPIWLRNIDALLSSQSSCRTILHSIETAMDLHENEILAINKLDYRRDQGCVIDLREWAETGTQPVFDKVVTP
jgi:hypothetical protein